MPFVLPAPDDLRAWIHGAVVLNAPAHSVVSCFPAQASSMLVVRSSGSVWLESPTGAKQALPAAALIAPSTRFARFVHQGAVDAVGLVLRRGCLPCLIQGSAAGWADRFVALDALPHPQLRQLVEQVHGAADVCGRVQTLFAAMRAVVHADRHGVYHQRLEQLGQAVVHDLSSAAQRLGLGTRQLQRQCLAGFGLTPKQLHTTARLHATLLATACAPVRMRGTDAELALDHGFFDQSHLGRDMRRLVGTSLSQLRRDSAQTGAAYWPVALGRQLQ